MNNFTITQLFRNTFKNTSVRGIHSFDLITKC